MKTINESDFKVSEIHTINGSYTIDNTHWSVYMENTKLIGLISADKQTIVKIYKHYIIQMKYIHK